MQLQIDQQRRTFLLLPFLVLYNVKCDYYDIDYKLERFAKGTRVVVYCQMRKYPAKDRVFPETAFVCGLT
jgi:hypothetical protein